MSLIWSLFGRPSDQLCLKQQKVLFEVRTLIERTPVIFGSIPPKAVSLILVQTVVLNLQIKDERLTTCKKCYWDAMPVQIELALLAL